MMRRPPPAAVLFDMDGVLIDSERVAADCVFTAGETLGLTMPDHLPQRLIGLGRDSANAVMVAEMGKDFPLVAFVDVWHAHYESRLALGVPAKAGALQLLRHLGELGINCAVATSTSTPMARLKLEKAGLLPHLQAVVGRDVVADGKPAPDVYLEASRRLGVSAAQCWAFEDSLPGLRAARASGARTHWVPDMATVHAHELPEQVETLSSLTDALSWLQPFV